MIFNLQATNKQIDQMWSAHNHFVQVILFCMPILFWIELNLFVGAGTHLRKPYMNGGRLCATGESSCNYMDSSIAKKSKILCLQSFRSRSINKYLQALLCFNHRKQMSERVNPIDSFKQSSHLKRIRLIRNVNFPITGKLGYSF